MLRAQLRAASRKAAKVSRRADVCARNAARERAGQSWDGPLRRSRQDIDSALRLIDSSSGVIESASRSAHWQPVRSTQRLHHVYCLVSKAAARLEHAGGALRDTADRLALAPERVAEAQPWLVDTTMRWGDAMVRLAELSDWLGDIFATLLHAAESGLPLRDASLALVGDGAASAVPSRSDRRRRSSSSLDFIRRQRSAPAAAVDAARRIARGRAPPFASTCPL